MNPEHQIPENADEIAERIRRELPEDGRKLVGNLFGSMARAGVERLKTFMRGPEGENVRELVRLVDATSGGQLSRAVTLIQAESAAKRSPR